MTTLEKTSAEIRRLVPRLLKLQKGCLFSPSENFKSENGYFEFCEDDIFELVHLDTKYECQSIHSKVRGVIGVPNRILRNAMIIGHPITLEDVLEAIDEKVSCIHRRGDARMLLVEAWQHGKPYDQQSPEFHEFVANIILKNNELDF
jgi:hypothetical protein